MFDFLSFDNPYFIVRTIGLLTVGAYLVYRFQLFSLIKSTFFDKGRSKFDIEIESKVDQYLSMHDSDIKEESEIPLEQVSLNPPSFHLLRTIKNENIITIYFANNGEGIFNIEIQSSDIKKISIEPKEKILNNESGDFKFYIDDSTNDKINFELFYSDKLNNKMTKKYSYSIEDEMLAEVF